MTRPNPMSSNVRSRAEQLDTIAAILPMNRRDMLAGILTDQDVETLRHLVNEGMGENTLRALTSDLAYLEAWSMAATGSPSTSLHPKHYCSNSWPTISGGRCSARLNPITVCQPTWKRNCANKAFYAYPGHMHRPPCVVVWLTGQR